MKLGHVAERVLCRPWVIMPEAHETIRMIVAAHIAGGQAEADARALGSALAATATQAPAVPQEPEAPPYMLTGDGVAIVPLVGVLAHRVGPIEQMSGMTDTDAFSDAVRAAEDDPAVRGIVLAIDSPGGEVSGVPEAAAAVRVASKPAIAVADGLAGSGAYWIASQAQAVYASESARVGSIGAYMAVIDQSRAYADAGLSVEVFRSGSHKGAGIPGTSLTAEQREHLQAQTDRAAAMFRASVSDRRPWVSADVMDGRAWYSRDALGLGLVDSLGGVAEAVRDVIRLAAMSRQS